jgi:FO synthase subunit 2
MSILQDIQWDSPGRLDCLLPVIDPAVATLLEKALDGGELDFCEGLTLSRTRGHELEALVLAADLLRRKRVGDVITYVVNRNINFTNICFIGCRFCAFSRAPREKDA